MAAKESSHWAVAASAAGVAALAISGAAFLFGSTHNSQRSSTLKSHQESQAVDKSVAQPSAERLGSDSQSEEAATAEKAVLCLLRDACIATGAQAAAVFLQDPRTREFGFVAYKESLQGGILCDFLQLPVDGSTTVGSAASSSRPIVLVDPARSHMQVAIRKVHQVERDPRNTLCVPIILKNGASASSVAVLEVYDVSLPTPALETSLLSLSPQLSQAGNRWLPLLHGHALQLQAVKAEQTSNRLRQIAQELALCESTDQVVQAIERMTYELLKPQRTTLFLVDAAANKLTIALSMDATGLSIPMGGGSIAGTVARTGAVVNLPDAYEDARFSRAVDEKTGFRTKSMLCVPVKGAHGRIVAVLQAINRTLPAPASSPRSLMPLALALAPQPDDGEADDGTPRGRPPPVASPVVAEGGGISQLQRQTSNDGIYSFSDGDLDIVLSMAAHAGISFSKAKLLEEAQRARDRSKALLQVVRAVAAKADIPTLLHDIVEAAESVVRAKRVSLFLVDKAKDQLWAIVSQDIAGARIPLGKGIAGCVARTGKRLNIPDAQNSVHFNENMDSETGFRTRQVLCMPIQMPGHREVIAVLQCVNSLSGRPFDEDDESSLEIFCAEVANALQRRSMDARLYKVMQDSRAQDAGGAAGMRRQGTSETDFQTSVLDFYSNGHTSVTLRSTSSSSRLSFRSPGASNSMSAMSASRRAELIPPKDPLLRWDFNVFNSSDDEKYLNFARMLNHYALPQRLKLDRSTLARFTRAVRGKYRDENPFHNWNHGWDVMHTTFLLLHHTPADSVLEWLEIMAVLTAALCHDIDHPGHSQSYEINTFSPMALQHNDSAVLERHHAHTTFRVLLETNEEGQQHHNIFAGLPAADFRKVRKVIIAAILATDMGKHFHMVSALNARAVEAEQRGLRLDAVLQSPVARHGRSGGGHRVSRSMSHAEMDTLSLRQGNMDRSRQHSSPSMDQQLVAFDSNDEGDRLQLMEALVHTADLGGQAYAPEVADMWGTRVVQEFQAQAAKEAAAQLPVAPFMACLGTPLAAHKTQLSFVDNVMAPLWTSLATLLPGLATPLANIRANRAHYAVQIERLQGASEPPSAPPSEDLTPSSSSYSVAEPVMTLDELTISAAISEASVEDVSPRHSSPSHSLESPVYSLQSGASILGGAGAAGSVRSQQDLEAGDDGVGH